MCHSYTGGTWFGFLLRATSQFLPWEKKKCRFGHFFCPFFLLFLVEMGSFSMGGWILLEKICRKDEEWGWEEWTRTTLMYKLAGWNIYSFDNTLFPVLLIKPFHHQSQTYWVAKVHFLSFLLKLSKQLLQLLSKLVGLWFFSTNCCFQFDVKWRLPGAGTKKFSAFCKSLLWKKSPGPVSNPS